MTRRILGQIWRGSVFQSQASIFAELVSQFRKRRMLGPDPVEGFPPPTRDRTLPIWVGKRPTPSGCRVTPEHQIWRSLRQPDSSLQRGTTKS